MRNRRKKTSFIMIIFILVSPKCIKSVCLTLTNAHTLVISSTQVNVLLLVDISVFLATTTIVAVVSFLVSTLVLQ